MPRSARRSRCTRILPAMDDFLDSASGWNWTAIGTITLAFVTIWLAGATVWLGWSTRRMEVTTSDMALHTRRLADAEAERRLAEQRAYLRVTARGLREPLRYTYAFENLGNGPATDVEILYGRREMQTALRRAEVAPREQWRLSDGDLESSAYRVRAPIAKPRGAGRDAAGVVGWSWPVKSEIYVWASDSLEPDVQPAIPRAERGELL